MKNGKHQVLKYAVLFSIGLMLLFAVVLTYYHQSQAREFHVHQEKLSERSVKDASKQIQFYIEKQRRTVSLFGDAHTRELSGLPDISPNEPLATPLWPKLSSIEPEARNFTLADDKGQIMLDDPQKIVGRGCRNDILFYAEYDYPNKLFIHTNDVIGEHIDIITPIRNSNGGNAFLFFVSLSLSELTEILTRGQADHHRLMLVDEQDQIQLTSHGRPQQLVTLNQNTAAIIRREKVPGTRWEVVDMMPSDFYQQKTDALAYSSLAIFLLLSSLGIPLLWLIFREEKGRLKAETALVDSHQMLEELLEKRTSALLESKNDLDYLSQHDLLTGLLNRTTFTSNIAGFMQGGGHTSRSSLAYIDLDRFNVINETAGHDAGDKLLQEIAELIRQIPNGCTYSRLSGDLFALFFPHKNADDTLPYLKELQEQIQSIPGQLFGAELRLSASIGLTEITSPETEVHNYLAQADIALHRAKEHGKGHICMFDTLSQELEQRSRLLQHSINIEKALKEDRLTLYHQSIVNLEDSYANKSRIEILVRLKDYDGSIIPPGDFIPAAEQFGQMPDLDYWVTEHTIKWMKRQASCPIVHINLSGQSITSEQSFDRYMDLLNHAPHKVLQNLCFEITETTAVQDFSQAIKFIQAAKWLGVSFALDDYGSGVCSFSYLRTLPVDILKIDGELVRSMSEDNVNSAMVESIVSMAKAMQLRCVAEFIEDETTLRSLSEMGVDYGQGYLFSKPEPLV